MHVFILIVDAQLDQAGRVLIPHIKRILSPERARDPPDKPRCQWLKEQPSIDKTDNSTELQAKGAFTVGGPFKLDRQRVVKHPQLRNDMLRQVDYAVIDGPQ